MKRITTLIKRTAGIESLRTRARFLRSRSRLSYNRVVLRTWISCSDAPVTIQLHVPGMGLFAHLSWVLLALSWGEREGKCIRFACTNQQYNRPGEQEDWLSAVVAQKAKPGGRRVVVNDYQELPCARTYPKLDRASAYAFFGKHLFIEAKLEAQASEWFCRNFEGRAVVGIHYRGTDKKSEAPRLSYEDVLASLNCAVQAMKTGSRPVSVFVATDEPGFLAYARDRLRDTPVLALEDAIRTDSPTGVHNAGYVDGGRLAREAMIDALLLSKTDLIFKTASALSAWAAILSGPETPVVMLSQPFKSHWYFPDDIVSLTAFVKGQEHQAAKAALALFERGDAARSIDLPLAT